jgi:hypothetical protein
MEASDIVVHIEGVSKPELFRSKDKWSIEEVVHKLTELRGAGTLQHPDGAHVRVLAKEISAGTYKYIPKAG